MLVNGEQATLDASGRFNRKVKLSTGINSINILALTRDGA